MIKSNNMETLTSARNSLIGEAKVCAEIEAFVKMNMRKCESDNRKDFNEWLAWIDAETAILNRIEHIKLDLEEIREQIKYNR